MNEQLIEASRQGRLEDVKRLLARREDWDENTLNLCVLEGNVDIIIWIAKRFGHKKGLLENSFGRLVGFEEWRLARDVVELIPRFFFPHCNFLLMLYRLPGYRTGSEYIEERYEVSYIKRAIEESWKKTIEFRLTEEDRIKILFPIKDGPRAPELYGTMLSFLMHKMAKFGYQFREMLKWAMDLNPPYATLWGLFEEYDLYDEVDEKLERELVDRPLRDMAGMTEEEKVAHMKDINGMINYVLREFASRQYKLDKLPKLMDIVEELRERLATEHIEIQFTYMQLCNIYKWAEEDSDLEAFAYQQLTEQPYERITKFLNKPEEANWVVDYLADNDRYHQNDMYQYLTLIKSQLGDLLSFFDYRQDLDTTKKVIDIYLDYAERVHPLLRLHYQNDAQYRAAVEVGPVYDRALKLSRLEHNSSPIMFAFWADELGTGPLPWDAGRHLGRWSNDRNVEEQNRRDARYQAWSLTTNPEMRQLFLNIYPDIRQRVDQMRLAMVRGLDPQQPGERQLPTELRARINQFL